MPSKGNNGYANMPHCYVICTLPIFIYLKLHSPPPKMKEVRSSPTAEKTTQSQNPKDNHNLNNHCENPKSYNGHHTQCGLPMKTVTTNMYTGCPRRNVPDFGRVFLMLKYTDVNQNTYVQNWTVTEIMAREKCGLLAGPHTVPVSWQVLSMFVLECGVRFSSH